MDSKPRRLIESRDILRFQIVSDPQISPDGSHVAWVKTWPDLESNSYRSQIWLTNRTTGVSRALTEGRLETHPRWSPDGKYLAYLSSGQLHVMPSEGSDRGRKLTDLRRGVSEIAWSPDGSRLVFSTLVDPERGLERLSDPSETEAEDPFVRFNSDVMVVRRLRWKSDSDGLLGNLYSHIGVVEAFPETDELPCVKLVARGAFDLRSPTWSPDGKHLAAIGNVRPEADQTRKVFIYLLNPEDMGKPEELAGLEDMRYASLAWSPDGTKIAFCGHNTPRVGHYGYQKLWLLDVAQRSASCVTEHLDLTFCDASRNYDVRGYGGTDGPRWLPDGTGLFLLVNEAGRVYLAHFDLQSAAIRPVTEGDCVVFAFTLDAAAETIALAMEHDLAPADVYVVEGWKPDAGPQPMRQLTAVNAQLLGELKLSRPERMTFASGDVTVEGWVIPPPDREPGRKYPVILYNGGGPGGMRAAVFVHEYQLYAAQGYVVIHCNARGNYGYGEAFSLCIRGKWGELDYQDNLNFLRVVCERLDYADPERLGVAGGSYGGYMTTWFITHHPVFRAAVVDRCLVNRFSHNGTSDIGYLLDQTEFDGRLPWEDPQLYLERSPLLYVANVKTPTLVVHSENDYRCPVEQGEQLFMALKRVGVPTELVRFKGENHDLSRRGRPWHRVLRLEKYLEWFRRYL